MDSDTYQPPRSVAEEFGEDLGPPLFTDDTGPGPRSSAARHAARRKANDREAAEAHEMNQLANVVQEAREDAALERAVDLIDRGGVPGHSTRALAMCALARREGSGLTSAEELAARHMARNRPEHDADHDRRTRRS